MAYILGTIGDETLTGTIGNDTIDHKGGSDVVNGGGGIDTLVFFDHSSHYAITSLLGVTRIFGYGRAAAAYTGEEVLLVNVEKVQFQNTLITLAPTPAGVMLGTPGNDILSGTLGADIIDHRGGSDFIDGNAGFDTVLFFDNSSHYGITALAGQVRVFGYGRADETYRYQQVDMINVESIQFLDKRMTYGSSGDDVLPTWSGKDVVDGGGGIDTVVFDAARAAFTVSRNASVINVGGASGGDTLMNVERLQFADKSLAFDLYQGQAGYNTAMIATAAFGKSVLDDEVFYGIGLRFAEQFGNIQQVADAVVDLGFFDHLDNRAFVQQIFQNVQHVPTAEESTLYEWALNFGIDRSQVLRVFAESDDNIQSVNLVGLQQNGVEFI